MEWGWINIVVFLCLVKVLRVSDRQCPLVGNFFDERIEVRLDVWGLNILSATGEGLNCFVVHGNWAFPRCRSERVRLDRLGCWSRGNAGKLAQPTEEAGRRRVVEDFGKGQML